jgi:hypothetical protein
MAHQDGRCASDAETIYVQQTTGCSTAADPAGGTAAVPFCGLDKAAAALSASRRLLVVRGTVQGTAWTLQGATGDAQVSIVGQQGAVVAGGASPGLRIISSDVFVRDLVVRRSEQIGLSASAGSTLRLSGVAVENNGGGGISIDASAFEIVNVRVTGNGPGTAGPVTWGGILLQSTATTGPRRLERTTIQNNNGPGVSCTASVDAVAVSLSGNASTDATPICGITSCGAPSASCGAM